MNDDELRRLWQEEKMDVPAKLSPGEQIRLMRIKMKAMDRVLLWGNTFDIVALAVSIPVFGWFGWSVLTIQPLMARIGWMIMIGSFVFSIWKGVRLRRHWPQPMADATVTQWLRHELERIRAGEPKRIRFLRCELPFGVGLFVFTWGLDIPVSSRVFFTALFMGMGVILDVAAWKLNQYTWRSADLPLIEELESLLKLDKLE
jgi:hypothetical protein